FQERIQILKDMDYVSVPEFQRAKPNSTEAVAFTDVNHPIRLYRPAAVLRLFHRVAWIDDRDFNHTSSIRSNRRRDSAEQADFSWDGDQRAQAPSRFSPARRPASFLYPPHLRRPLLELEVVSVAEGVGEVLLMTHQQDAAHLRTQVL